MSGCPLVALLSIWAVGRAAMMLTRTIGVLPAVAIDALFLLLLLFICAREVIAGRKWKDLKVVGGLTALSIANIFFHYSVISGGTAGSATRLAVGVYSMLMIIVVAAFFQVSPVTGSIALVEPTSRFPTTRSMSLLFSVHWGLSPLDFLAGEQVNRNSCARRGDPAWCSVGALARLDDTPGKAASGFARRLSVRSTGIHWYRHRNNRIDRSDLRAAPSDYRFDCMHDACRHDTGKPRPHRTLADIVGQDPHRP